MMNDILTLEPGRYLLLENGLLDGPYADIETAARNCVDDGGACRIVVLGAAYRPRQNEEV